MHSPESNVTISLDLARKDEAVDDMVARARVLVRRLDVTVAAMEQRLGRQGM